MLQLSFFPYSNHLSDFNFRLPSPPVRMVYLTRDASRRIPSVPRLPVSVSIVGHHAFPYLFVLLAPCVSRFFPDLPSNYQQIIGLTRRKEERVVRQSCVSGLPFTSRRPRPPYNAWRAACSKLCRRFAPDWGLLAGVAHLPPYSPLYNKRSSRASRPATPTPRRKPCKFLCPRYSNNLLRPKRS